MTVFFRIKLADGTEIPSAAVQGSGGKVGSGSAHLGVAKAGLAGLKRLRLAARAAERGDDSGLYEPKPHHAAAYPEHGGSSDGPEIAFDLRGATFLVDLARTRRSFGER